MSDNVQHKKLKLRRYAIGGVLLAALTVILAACGGGRDSGDLSERVRPLGVGLGSAVSWTPSSFELSMNPGSRQEIPITVTSKSTLTNVSIVVVPELRGLVTVQPTVLATVPAGQPVPVTITIAPSAAETLRKLDGTIHLVVGSSTIAKPLPVKLGVVAPEIVNGVSVPPEPPKVLNNLTLAGFDINQDGVRDDIERWIVFNTNDSARKRANLMAYARADQRGILSGNTEDAIAAGNEGGRAIECFSFLGIPRNQRRWKEVLTLMLNTRDRIQANEVYQDRLNGTVFGMLPPERLRSACNFDVEILPN